MTNTKSVNLANGDYAHVCMYGFFLSEETYIPVNDVTDVLSIAEKIMKEFHERAFAFRRMTVASKKAKYIDPGWLYLSGKVELKSEVFARNDPQEDILRTNMEHNDLDAIIRIFDHAMPFDPKKDVNLEIDMSDIKSGKFFE